MRGLGKDLGVEAMSLYKHVGRREELVLLLRAQLFSTLELPARAGSARRDLEEICRALWRGLSKNEGASFLLPLSPNSDEDDAPESGVASVTTLRAVQKRTPPWLPILERMLVPLRELIPEPLDRAYAVHALFSFVLGQVVFAAREKSVAGQRLGGSAGLEEFPEVALILPALQKRSPEGEFELGLRALLDSMEERRGF